jgi:hypothetical protein
MQQGLGSIVWLRAWSWHAKGTVRLSSSTIVHKCKLVLERTQESRATCQDGGFNNDAGTVNRADYGTIVHKRKLVLELAQRGFPTNRPLRWLALYGYLQFLCVLIEPCWRPLCQDIDVTNVSIPRCLKMGPVLATEGKLHQTNMYARCWECAEANGAGAGASNDGTQTNDRVTW